MLEQYTSAWTFLALLALVVLVALMAVQIRAERAATAAAPSVRRFATLEAALRDSTLEAGQALRLDGSASSPYGTHFEVAPAGQHAPDGIITYAQPRSGVQLVRHWDSTHISAAWAGAEADYDGPGNAHTNNTEPFTKIEQFIRDHPGTTVTLGAGAYGFDTTLSLDNVQHFTFEGKGQGVTELVFVPRATYNASAQQYEYERIFDRRGLTVRGGSEFPGKKEQAGHGTFRNLTFRGHANAPNAIVTGVNFNGRVSHMTFENVEVKFISGQGIRNGANRDSGDHFRYINNNFHHISTWDMIPEGGAVGKGGVGAIHRIKSDAVVRGNRFWASGTSAYFHAIYFDGYGENIRVVDNEFISKYPAWNPAEDPVHEQIAFCDLKIADHDRDQPKNTGDAPNNDLYENYNVFKNVTIKDNLFRNSFSNMIWSSVDSLTATNNRFEDTMLKITERATHVDMNDNTFTRSTDYRKITNLKNATGAAYLGANSMLKIAGAGRQVLIRNNTFRDTPDFDAPWPFAIEVRETPKTASATFRGNRIEATRGLLFREAEGGTVLLTGNTIITRGQAPRGGGDEEERGMALLVQSRYGGRVQSVENTYRYQPGRAGQRVQFFGVAAGAPLLRSLRDTFVVPSRSAKRAFAAEQNGLRMVRPTVRVARNRQ